MIIFSENLLEEHKKTKFVNFDKLFKDQDKIFQF